MKERPILFSSPMVRAILEGRKTQTRRVVNLPCNVEHAEAELTRMQPGYEDGTRPIFGIDDEPNAFSVKCPYGAPGDRLWVRETHARCTVCHGVDWRANDDGQRTCRHCDSPLGNWKPSIFMRREYSRITLEIEAVRVKRLKDISEEDCRAEGCKGGNGSIPGYAFSATPREHYRHVWQSINGHGSWDSNPWVWVIQFRRVKP